MRKERDFLTKRKGSDIWYLQLQWPKDLQEIIPACKRRTKIVTSTGTNNRFEARARSFKKVDQFKKIIESRRIAYLDKPTQLIGAVFIQEPGTVLTQPDGSVLSATPEWIYHIGSDQRMKSKPIPNREIAREVGFFVSETKQLASAYFPKFDDGTYPEIPIIESLRPRVKALKSKKDIDSEIIDNWANMRNVSSRFVDDAKATLEIFHAVTKQRTFYTADYDDGVALADALFAKGNKSATVRKKIAFLRAAFNEGTLSPKRFPGLQNKTNPFSRVIRKVEHDAQDKVMFDDDDTFLIKSRMSELGQNERILLTWCLATGCRRSEPFYLEKEMRIDGFRCIRFEEKNVKKPASDRTIPLPPILLDLYPEPISGPLFTDSAVNIGKNINKWLKKIGITDPSKTLHSTRHRAAYRLRLVVDRDSVRHECLGHENRTEASEGYGAYPQAVLDKALRTVW